VHWTGQAALAEAREKGLAAKLASATREIEALQRFRTAAAASIEATEERQDGQQAEHSARDEPEETHRDLPDAPANATEPYEALIASLQADVKRLEAACERSTRASTELAQELTDVKSSSSEKLHVLQMNLEESWERYAHRPPGIVALMFPGEGP
jgi:chromosome segregation ATPase